MTAQTHQPKPIDIANTAFSGYIPTNEELNKEKILKALDIMALALAHCEYIWRPEDRKLYEEAIKELKN